ncbi:DUF4190 domain-containing protein [Gordonia sp. TBRC 11910]|uniref:DUF4190 domain-containing protein n=1 Tax=Gordonia asplenii TaxID=2725283 RepID=A0A848KWJ4_9ACTN|nr:DUF4190 domain-containing protein [Gordonia asplenii]NMO00541.1 DUF4190 domain-containing protein [Gordonia asplenii]
MTGPDMSKPGPSAEPGAYDQTQLRDVSKLDLNKQPAADDFSPVQSNPGYQPSNPGYQPSNPGYQPSNPGYQAPTPGYEAQSNPGYQQSNPGYQAQPNPGYQPSNPGYQPPSTPYVAPGASSQPNYSGYPAPSYPQQPYAAGYPAAQPYGAQYPGAYPGGYGYTATTTNTKAIVSLILGIAGLTATCGLLGIGGLILGYLAKREIDESGGTQDGSGLALAGIILGWICVAVIVLFVAFIIISIATS